MVFLIAEIVGWVATVFRSVGMLARSAVAVKWLVSVGNLFWMINGIMTCNRPLIASNGICLVIMLADWVKCRIRDNRKR